MLLALCFLNVFVATPVTLSLTTVSDVFLPEYPGRGALLLELQFWCL